jgi:hypothetical protein
LDVDSEEQEDSLNSSTNSDSGCRSIGEKFGDACVVGLSEYEPLHGVYGVFLSACHVRTWLEQTDHMYLAKSVPMLPIGGTQFLIDFGHMVAVAGNAAWADLRTCWFVCFGLSACPV